MRHRKQTAASMVLMLSVIAGLALVGAGCSTLGSHCADLPDDVQVAGGGFSIMWQAPQEGTAYVVEKTSNKILATETLAEDEWFEYEVEQEDGGAVFKMTTGVSLEEARIVLYFLPEPE
jgi:hypothetical protein